MNPDDTKQFPVLWLDLETTGTDHTRHGVIQIAGIIEVAGEEAERFNFRVCPFGGDVIEDEAFAVNGTTRDEIATFAPPNVVKQQLSVIFEKYVAKYDKTSKFIFAGYNATFDMNFMHAWFRKCGDPYFGSWVWWPPLDVAVIAMHHLALYRHQFQSFKLGALATALGIVAEGNLHDAMADIVLTRRIYLAMPHVVPC